MRTGVREILKSLKYTGASRKRVTHTRAEKLRDKDKQKQNEEYDDAEEQDEKENK